MPCACRSWTARLLKKAHLLRWRASALAAAYQEYAWTHPRWIPGGSPSALHVDLFEQPKSELPIYFEGRESCERSMERTLIT